MRRILVRKLVIALNWVTVSLTAAALPSSSGGGARSYHTTLLAHVRVTPSASWAAAIWCSMAVMALTSEDDRTPDARAGLAMRQHSITLCSRTTESPIERTPLYPGHVDYNRKVPAPNASQEAAAAGRRSCSRRRFDSCATVHRRPCARNRA